MTSNGPKTAKTPKILVFFNRANETPDYPGIVDDVLFGLREAGYNVVAHDLDDDIDRVGQAVVVERPAALFSVVRQIWADPMQVAPMCGLFDLYGYPYVGSDPLAQSTALERARTHVIAHEAGIPVSGFAIVRDINAIPDTEGLEFPLVITQAFDDTYDLEGPTYSVHSREEVERRVEELNTEYELPLLIEEYIDARSIHAIVSGKTVLNCLPLVERVADEEGEINVVAQLDQDTAERLRGLAIRAFRALDCRDVAQVDFRLTEDGDIRLIDVRPMFELGAGSVFRTACDACEGGMPNVLRRIVELALTRARKLEEAAEPAVDASESAVSPTEPAEEPTSEDITSEDIASEDIASEADEAPPESL